MIFDDETNTGGDTGAEAKTPEADAPAEEAKTPEADAPAAE